MRIRILEKDTPWAEAKDDWFYDYRNSIFKVVGVYSGEERLYAVDVIGLRLSLPAIDFGEGPLLVPSRFCELLPD